MSGTQRSIRHDEYKFSDVTGKIIGCAMEVHSTFGCGFQEVVYQRSLAFEMSEQGLSFARELSMPLVYKGHDVGTRRVNFLVEDTIMVELKAVATMEPVHLAQTLNYLEACNLEIGLLLNFGSERLGVKRLLNKKYKPALELSK
jgi:GxxExxY protein